MPTANEFEWIRRMRCQHCKHSAPTSGHGVVYCTLHFQTMQKKSCCTHFRYRPDTYVFLTREYPTKYTKPSTQ